MLLTCPHCETIFRVDTTDIKPGGRHVRCSVCSHVWVAKRGGADAIAEDADLVEQMRSWRGVIIMVALVITMTALATINRNFIAANAEWTRPVYQSIGLTTVSQLEKLDVTRLSATRKRDTIRINGELTNLSNWNVLAPAMLVTVTDSFGLILAEKSFSLDTDIITGAMSIPFSTQIMLEETLDNDVVTEIVVIPITATR